MSNPLLVRKAAVLGAGVMGAQIAAHLTNAGVDTVLFDLPAKEGHPDGIVHKAIANLAKLSPAPLASKSLAEAITPANYETGLEHLRDCDLIIEAIAERMDWKQDLYRKIAPFVADHAVLASNTSGLGINKLAEVLPEELRHRFSGVHFFNPPRYMHLAELIPAKSTDTCGAGRPGDLPDHHPRQGRGVRQGHPELHRQSHWRVLDPGHGAPHRRVQAGLRRSGRGHRSADRPAEVGDLPHLRCRRPGHHGPRHQDHGRHPAGRSVACLLHVPEVAGSADRQGRTRPEDRCAGIFRKVGKDIVVLDLEKQDYRAADRTAAPEVVEILKIRNPAEKFARLRESQHPQAQFLWAVFRDLFHYSAYHLADIAHTARDVDLAIRWGYGWSLGPFETWQAAGWKQVAQWIADDIAAGKAMSNAPLPNWVFDGRDGVHADRRQLQPGR